MEQHNQPPSGARESGAGDDFHLLWAARRVLSLLHPQSDLTGVRVEGPPPSESNEVDPEGDELLGVDIAEYFGGEDFQAATRVVHSQLKYSTRRPLETWTAARLAKGKGTGHKGSIIHRLAQIYKAYLDKHGREAVLEKLQIRLVSNRPCYSHLRRAITRTKRVLAGKPGGLDSEALLDHVGNNLQCEQLKRLEAGTVLLDSYEFTDFLRVLDLSQCGQPSRLDQDIALLQEIGSLGFSDARGQYSELKNLLERRMMPESRGLGVLTAEDIVPIFGIPHPDDLFPAPSRFEDVGKPVDRVQATTIARQIQDAGQRPVCIHGMAGMGKTTLVRSLERHFPEGSVVIVFDCFGGGSYMDRAEVRHGYPRAIMQIANELAAKVGSHLLLNRQRPSEDLLRELLRRLSLAARTVQGQHPDALTVLVIDAADNSLAVGKTLGQESFVDGLLTCMIPEGCRLVLTARTRRIGSLRMPSGGTYCMIEPFTFDETMANVARYVPGADESDIREFHRLSKGIPRVQDYALRSSSGSVGDAIDLLRPGGKTLDSLIDKQLEEAGLRLGDKPLAEKVCRVLLALPRPVPIEYAALLAEADGRAVADFCTDMSPGLVVEGDAVSFRDEDFETRLDERFGDDRALHAQLAGLLYDRRGRDRYAAVHLADALRRADRGSDLMALVHDEGPPQAVLDPIERTEVFLRRVQLALEAALRTDHSSELFKLLFLAAEAVKTDQAVETLLIQNSDLAYRYGDPAAIQRLHLGDKNDGLQWFGPAHLLCAANLSRNRETHSQANRHLKLARAWIRHWSSTPKEERQGPDIAVEDIASGAEALLRLEGPNKAAAWLSGWAPRSAVFEAILELARRLIQLDGHDAFALLGHARIRADCLLAIVDASMVESVLAPSEWVHRAAEVWRRFATNGKKPDASLLRPGISLCEAVLLQGGKAQLAIQLLHLFAPSTVECRSTLYSEKEAEAIDSFLRGRALLSELTAQPLNPTDVSLLPEQLRNEPEGAVGWERRHWDQERSQFQELYEFLLPAYVLRARVITGSHDPHHFDDDLQKAMASGGWKWSSRMRNDVMQAKKLKALVIADAVVRCCPDTTAAFKEVCDHYCRDGWGDMAEALARKAVQATSLHSVAVGLIADVVTRVTDYPVPAKQLIDTCVTCSRIAGRVDPELGRRYFDMAVKAAAEIDEEAIDLLRLVATLAERAVVDDPSSVEHSLATSLAEVVEDYCIRLEGWDYFPWDDSISAITRLSPAVAAAALARWDQNATLSFVEHSPVFIDTCLSLRRLAPSVAVSFTTLAPLGSERSVRIALAGLSALKTAGPEVEKYLEDALSTLADHAVRLAPLDRRRRLSEEVVEWAEINGFGDHAAIADARSLLEFFDKQEDVEAEAAPPRIAPRTVQQDDAIAEVAQVRINWDDLMGTYRFDEPSSIEGACRSLEDLVVDKNMSPGEVEELQSALLSKIRERATPKEYVRHLDALSVTSISVLSFDVLVDALAETLGQWGHHPLVGEWRQRLPFRLAEYRFGSFFWSDCLNLSRLDRLESRLNIQRGEMCEAILHFLPRHLEMISPQAVYNLMQHLVSSLPAGSAMELLRWAVPRLNSRIRRTELACRDISTAGIPTDCDGLMATVLWFMFGHPDKRVRWRAIHTARRMARLGDPHILCELAKWLDAGQSHPFSMPGTAFYWLAARQWFFLLLDRLSAESPAAVLPLADRIAQETVSPEAPHALIMRFAKRTALRLARLESSPYDKARIHAIEASLTPIGQSLKKPEMQQRLGILENSHRASVSRFPFDTTDTLPYWYSQPGCLFGIDMDAFCRAAERWIRDVWGFVGDVRTLDPLSKRRFHDWNWTLTSNRHGSSPPVEDLRTYLEFNAMFCVAGELIRSRPLAEDDWTEDPWEAWLRGWDLACTDEWLTDHRQGTPLEKMFWQWVEKESKDWINCVADEDLDQAVGLIEASRPNCLVSKGHMHFYRHGHYKRITIDSALVSRETSHSLLHTLAICWSPHDHYLPLEGEKQTIGEVLHDGTRFDLVGWVREFRDDSEGIDQHDPLRCGLTKILVVPGTKMAKWAKLRFDNSRIRSFSPRHDSAVTVFERWSDCCGDRRSRPFQTEGYRLWISRNVLCSFLEAKGMDLIVECTIHRWRDEHQDEEERHVTQGKLYLIHSDGSIETTRSSYSPRETDRPRASVG